MDQSSLSWHTQSTVIILILLFHGGILTLLFIAHLEYEREQNEAIIIVDADNLSEIKGKTAIDWVAVQQALPAIPAPTAQPKPIEPLPSVALDSLPNLSAGVSPKEENPSDATTDAKINEAVALAQQLLQDSSQKLVKPAKKQDDINQDLPIEKESPIELHDKGTIIAQEETKLVPKKEGPKQSIANDTALQLPPSLMLSSANQSATSSGDKKSISLAQLTQGFVGHLEQAAMAVRSNRTGAATAEQLKQLNFCQKIISCIVNSYKIQRSNAPHNREMHPARILLVLNENGSINKLELHQSSGNQAMDAFLLEMFRDASSAFPPVPSSFNQKTYMLPIFNIDRLEALQSSQGWYIDNKVS